MERVKLNKIVSMYKKPVLGKVKSKTRFMALSVDKSTLNEKVKKGIAREITKSKGNVDVPGFIDESKLILVESENLSQWNKIKDLEIKGIKKIIKKSQTEDKYFIGLEDPDIWSDEKGTKHIYFTIAYKLRSRQGYHIYVGHAQGKSLENLTATSPVLSPIGKEIMGFKEAAISPIKIGGERINLNEMAFYDNEEDISMISASRAKNMGKPWKYQKIVLDPRKIKYDWIKGHASPCCLLPEDFIKINETLVGIVNGREKTKFSNGKGFYGKFRPGLVLFDPKTGDIPWVDSRPLLEDPNASTITFASDFIQTGKNKGILYCHVNDSFIRAYEIDGKELKIYLKEKINK